jgi:uncharacterized protein YegL
MVQRPLDAIEFARNPEPRCPCVLLLDVSGSMSGEPIEALNEGLRRFKEELVKDTLASKRVEVAIVTFSSGVEIVQDFVTVDKFNPPWLEAGGTTDMGSGILQALDLIRKRKETYRHNGVGYYRPWLFMITDGAPTEDEGTMRRAIQALQDEEKRKGVSFFAVAVEDADINFLSLLSSERRPVRLRGLAFQELFQWLSSSMQRVSSSRVGEKVNLPDPSGWMEVSS